MYWPFVDRNDVDDRLTKVAEGVSKSRNDLSRDETAFRLIVLFLVIHHWSKNAKGVVMIRWSVFYDDIRRLRINHLIFLSVALEDTKTRGIEDISLMGSQNILFYTETTKRSAIIQNTLMSIMDDLFQLRTMTDGFCFYSTHSVKDRVLRSFTIHQLLSLTGAIEP